MDYISTHFGVDSASHFPFRVSTDTTDHSTHDSVTADVKEAYSSLCYKHRTATGTHVPYGITQCYLPPGRGDIPAFTPAN